MTALPQYVRLEALGIWRETAEAQRREVIVFFGDATLVIADGRAAQPLTHWSLAALERLNPGKSPARYTPAADDGEELEIEDEAMVAAIDKVLGAIQTARPHPGRLRGWLIGGAAIACLVLVALWAPGAAIRQAVRVMPDAKRAEIGRAILADIGRTTGAQCHSSDGDAALEQLATRLPGDEKILAIMPRGFDKAGRVLPGNVVAVGRKMLNANGPEALAGAVIAAETAATGNDGLAAFMDWAGSRAAFQFLITGDLPRGIVRGYGQIVLSHPAPRASSDELITAFAQAELATSPYAYALDPTGESVLPLIEGDPYRDRKDIVHPMLRDAQWKALKTICK